MSYIITMQTERFLIEKAKCIPVLLLCRLPWQEPGCLTLCYYYCQYEEAFAEHLIMRVASS